MEVCLGLDPDEVNEEAALVEALDPSHQDTLDRAGWLETECENAESVILSVGAKFLKLPEKAESLTLPENVETLPVSDDISSLQVSAAEEDALPTNSSDSSARSCSLRLCRALLLPQPIFAYRRFEYEQMKDGAGLESGADYEFGYDTIGLIFNE